MKKRNNFLLLIFIILIIILLMIISFIILYNYKERNTKIEDNVTYTCPSNKYCIYNYEDNTYYVLNDYYDKEYDIEYSTKIDLEYNNKYCETYTNEEFKVLSYLEYTQYCENNNIEQKYYDENKKYIVFSYSTSNDITVKLSDVEYDNGTVRLYLWDMVSSSKIGVLLCDYGQEINTYNIIIPTDEEVNDYEVIPLLTKIQYNKVVGNYPMEGYKYTRDGNIKLVKNMHITMEDDKLTNVINNMLDTIAKQHTINIKTTTEYETTLNSSLDLISSVFKIQSGTEAIHYFAYTDDVAVSYYGYEDYYSYDYYASSRENMIYAIFSNFGNNSFWNSDNYNITLSEQGDHYIIDTIAIDNSTKYYIDKRTYLLEKTEVLEQYITDSLSEDTDEGDYLINRINEFSYNTDIVTIPLYVYNTDDMVTVDKPILYLYPTEDIDIDITLGNSNLLNSVKRLLNLDSSTRSLFKSSTSASLAPLV